MTKIAIRFFMDHEKEEKWLNDMESRGYHFLRFCFCLYIFAIGKPNTYTYRIELLEDMPLNYKSRDYLSFLGDTDVEHVASWARWVYLRKEKAKGPLHLFTDLNSKLKHFKRIFLLQMGLTPLFVITLINMLRLTGEHGGSLYPTLSILYGLLFVFFVPYAIKTYFRIKSIQKQMQLHE